METIGVPGRWHLECVHVSRFWSWLLKLPRVSEWIDDPGYSGSRWWFVSPEGERTFLRLMNRVGPGSGEAGPAEVLSSAANLLPSWGFSGMGYGIDAAAWKSTGSALPALATLPLAAWKAGLKQGVFEAGFEDAVAKACDSAGPHIQENQKVLGVLWEHPGALTPAALVLAYAACDPASASKRALVDHVRRLCGDSPDQLRSRLPAMRDFEDLLASREWPEYQMLGQDAEPFAVRVLGSYGEKVGKAVASRFPDCPNLGPVLEIGTPLSMVEALAPHVDVVSFSAWTPDGRLPRKYLEEVHRVTGKPVLIVEYGQKLLKGSGPVAQSVRGQATVYRRTAVAAAALPFAVGAGWTGYRDSAAEAWGFLDAAGQLRAPLAEIAAEVNAGLDLLHRDGMTTEDPGEFYREDRVKPPAQHVVRLPAGLKIDADLTDWPVSLASLNGVRPTRDLELMGFAMAFVGWNEEGIAVAAEVSDDALDAASPPVYWTGGDFVEVLVDASGARSPDYTPSVLHLALLPSGGGRDGSEPVAVAVHHPGDGLAGNVSDFKDVRVASAFVKDELKWKLEAMIPWTAVRTVPQAGARLGFNLIVRRVSGAGVEEAFWAAPRGERGLDHPSFWGELTLAAGGG